MLFHVREGVARCDLANFLQEGWAAGRIFFPQAVLLHAQCLANRDGFGRNANSGSRRYGETTQYLVTGAACGGRHGEKASGTIMIVSDGLCRFKLWNLKACLQGLV